MRERESRKRERGGDLILCCKPVEFMLNNGIALFLNRKACVEHF